MKTSFVNLSNTESIAYVEKGEEYKDQKPTLLFIHGTMSSFIWWNDAINALEQNKYHIIAVDLRGFGKSTYHNKCQHFLDWAQDLKQFCQLKGIKRCIPIGWSFGGGVSMKFAEIAPQIVSKLILTCSISHQGLIYFTNGQKCLTHQQIKESQLVKIFAPILSEKNEEAMSQLLQSMIFLDTPNYPQQKKKAMVSSAFQNICIYDVFYAMANSDIKIKDIKAKISMIHGQNDKIVLLETVQSTGKHCCNFVVLENRDI